MENKFIKIPFELELAKAISNGKAEGNIVTCNGRKARVVCWNYKSLSGTYPILALVENGIFEEPTLYTIDGRFKSWKSKGEQQKEDLMLEVPEYRMFKDGDVLIDGAGMPFIYNGIKDKQWGYGYICGLNYNKLLSINENIDEGRWTYIVKRRATETEKQELIEALKASKEPKAKEYLKRFFGVEQKQACEFKPFDKVLVRLNEGSYWCADLYSYRDKMSGKHVCVGSAWNFCLPFEGNEHLLGTNKNLE